MIRKKVVLYLRLSQEDGDDESSSITNQRRLLTEYAIQHGYEVVDEYIDDGVSGYKMDRPEFNRLKMDIARNKVDFILVKDFSRLGRHNANVQLFLEYILNEGKRIIITEDNYDTDDPSTHTMAGIKTWMNEEYLRDISKKVKRSIHILQKEGRFLCNVPYGYYKDPYDKNKCHVDHTIAPYIQKIFDMYINGKGVKEIARHLTEEKVPTPTMVRKQMKEANGQVSKLKVSGIWDTTVIIKILKNEFYLGVLVLNKTKARAIKGKPIVLPKEDNLKFPGHHEAIIDRQTFNLAQEIRLSRQLTHFRGIKSKVRKNLFAGMIFCADCGGILTTTGNTANTRYICKTYNVFGTSQCTSHAIYENDILDVVMEMIKDCAGSLQSVLDDLDNIIRAKMKMGAKKEDAIHELNLRLENAEKSLEVLIEMKMMEIMKNSNMADMINQTYSKMQNDKYTEIQSLKKQIMEHESKKESVNDIASDIHIALRLINEVLNSKEITKKQLLMLVEKIVVHQDSGVDIHLKGNLHELSMNYFKVSETETNTIKRHIYDYIKFNQNGFAKTDCTAYVIEQGVKTNYKVISRIINEDLYGLVAYYKNEHCYKALVPIEEIGASLLPNIVVGTARWLHHNSVTMELLCNICDWASSTEYKKHMF